MAAARGRISPTGTVLLASAKEETAEGIELFVGARVQLHSLLRAPELNGVQGGVVEFNARTGRWRVKTDPDGVIKALQAYNLTVLAAGTPAHRQMLAPSVGTREIHLLQRALDLNCAHGEIVSALDGSTGRRGVKNKKDRRVQAMMPDNLTPGSPLRLPLAHQRRLKPPSQKPLLKCYQKMASRKAALGECIKNRCARFMQLPMPTTGGAWSRRSARPLR
jgi:hypothetical protein